MLQPFRFQASLSAHLNLQVAKMFGDWLIIKYRPPTLFYMWQDMVFVSLLPGTWMHALCIGLS